MNCPDCNEPLRLDRFGLCPKCDAATFATRDLGAIAVALAECVEKNDAAWRLCGRCGGASVIETTAVEADQQIASCVCNGGYMTAAMLAPVGGGAGYIVGPRAASSDLERRMVAILGAATAPVGHAEFVAKLTMVTGKDWTDTAWNEAIETTVKRDVIRRVK